MLNSKVNRLQKDIESLDNQLSRALKDESDSIKKVNRASQSMSRTKSISTIRSKDKQVQRENDKAQRSKKKQADLLGKISRKNIQLNKAISNLNKEREKQQERILKDQEKKIRESKLQQKQAIDNIAASSQADTERGDEIKSYDVFISHSTEDKDGYVDELASALKKADIKIWYDSDAIGWGESIRQEIDKGLTHSKFGIVVLSPSFINKYSTNYEVNSILRREASKGIQTILPIWHNVTADQVLEYSSSLSGRQAMNTSIITIDEIVDNVKRLVKQ